MDNMASGDRRPAHSPLTETPAFLIAIGLCVVCMGSWLLLTKVYHFSNKQAAELGAYILSGLTIPSCAALLYATRRARREKRKVHPPLVMSPARDERIVAAAWDQGGVVPRVRHSWRSLAVARSGSGDAGDCSWNDR